jgi:Carbohydrate family 9 binding domain-like
LINGFVEVLLLSLIVSSVAVGADHPTIDSVQAMDDVPLDLDPAAPFWREASPVYMERDNLGKIVPGYRTAVRTRWTNNNLYFLFVCPFQELHLKPSPTTEKETNELWNWDVAEVFIGSSLADIKRYKEFEVSPQGEWIDLDIDLHKPHHEEGWTWSSGVEVSARIDQAAHIWYGAMRIPFGAIDTRPAMPGNMLRINLFRSQGPPPQQAITWQPPMSSTFHVPERFGLIRLVEKSK